MQQTETKKELTAKQEAVIDDKVNSSATITDICAKHNINRCTYYRWTKQKHFAEALDEAEQTEKAFTDDLAKNKIREMIEKGNVTALIFYLKAMCGWTETTGIDMKMKTPVIEVRNPEQKKAIEKMVQRVKKSE